MRLLLVILLTCAVTAGWSQSQHPELPFEHLPIPGTINSSQVNDLTQDHHGLVWISGNGLYRYDGYKFISYRTVSDSVSIAGQEINCLFSDAQNDRLLLGTHSHGIVAYSHKTETFSLLPSQDGVPIISHIAQTSDGTLWGSSFSSGLFYLKQDTLQKFRNQEKFNSNSCIAAVGNKLLVGGNRNVYIIQNKQLIDSIYIDFPGSDLSHVIRVTALTTDRAGKLWIGTEQFGVFVYDTLAKKIIKHFSPDVEPFHNRINRILEDKKNNIWILTKSQGLVVYIPETGNFIHVVKNPLSERSLSGNNCTSIFQDRNNIIWVGATGDLNKYDPSKIKFRHIFNNPFSIASLHDNMVRGIYEDKNKKLWVGTDGGVIHIFDEKKMNVEKIEIKIGGKKRIAPMFFLNLSDNILLIGSSEGLLQYDRRKKIIEYYGPLEKQTKGMQVRQMAIHNNILYFISFGYLKSFDLKTNELKNYTRSNDPTSVKNATVLYIDHENRLWAGVKNGISLFEPTTDSFRHFAFETNPSRPLGTYFMILSIEDFNGKLWVGTFNEGLWTFDLSNLKDPVITNISRKRDIQNMTVYSSIPDNAGNLWLSTNQGISRYNLQADKYTDFTVSEGLQQDEFNRLAYLKCSNGEIVFGGINGLNIFNPKNITLEEEDYTPILLNAAAFNEETNSNISIEVSNGSSFTMPHDQNDIDFNFFIPNYRSPRRYEVYYRLTGYNSTWLRTEINNLHYSNLKPGNYSFELKTVSGSGKEKLASVTFTVMHPIWQTWWFILLTICFTCLIVVTIIQGSLYKSRRDKIRLEELLSIRTKEIEKSREELANLNQKKDLIFSILSHDLRSPLTTLKGFLSILIDDNELSKEDIKKHASSIRNSVTSSLDLIDNTLFWSLSQTGNITYTPSTFSLNDMLVKVGNLYHLIVEKKKIQFSMSLEEPVTLFADENMTYVTLRNVVSNALKFTPQGNSVKITARKFNGWGQIIIEDEGIGMSQVYLEKLFTEDQLPLTKGTNDEKGTGLGLILCRKFIQLNNGKLHVKSVEGKGSQFIIELPLHHA